MTTTLPPKTNFRAVGTRPIRHDGYEKVTGQALYSADTTLPGLLYSNVLRSPHAHAKIISIDTSKAEAYPGVRSIITSKDFPEQENIVTSPFPGPPLSLNLKEHTDNVIAGDKVLHKGHAVAAVAAVSTHVAEEASKLIEVTYEILAPVKTDEEAIAEGAPQLHSNYEKNIASYNKLEIGDIEEGFKKADHIIEREFRTATVHQGYIEPPAATAWWSTDNRVTIWGSSQGQFIVRDRTSIVLGVPFSSVKVIPREIGGGFGGKTTIYLEPLAAMLSKKTGVPVKMAMSRSDVLEATGPTSGSYVKAKIGITNEGKLVAGYADLKFEAGAYPGSPVVPGATCMFSPYDMENISIDAYDIVTNKPKTTAYRAPGAPISAFAAESIIDELAEKIGMDPMDLRILNTAQEGTMRVNGITNPIIGCLETAEAIKNHDHYSSELKGKHTGRGVASGFWMNNTGAACAVAAVNYDGTVNLTIGQMDVGGLRVVAAQHVAEVLGIPIEDVIPQYGDTDTVGWTSVTGGSGGAFKTGWASYEAAQDIKKQMCQRVAGFWETPLDNVELVDGVFKHTADSELKMSFKDLSAKLPDIGGPVAGRANLIPGGPGSAFATHLVDVEVDVDTGKVTILRYTAAQDVGRAIHPSYVEGQIQGGAAQGIGWALNEEYFMNDDAKLMNVSLLDYRMPTSLDLPMIEAVIVEVPNPGHPYGVRGVGEVCIVPPLAAIANAIYDAIGIRMTELPMNPVAITKAIQEAKK